MALDIYLQPEVKAPRFGDGNEKIGELDDDGYFWFLYPLFEQLAARTGQRIDLYGDASFCGKTLDALSQTIAEAQHLVDSQPKEWQVVIGWTTKSVSQEVCSKVNRQQMETLLRQLEAAVNKAKAANTCVIFWGD